MISRLSPSPEQLAIIDTARQRHNILVEAIAGSGKTTTILEMARTLPDVSILQVTYNKSLKDEVRQKAKGLDNLLIHTYHSFARACFDVDGYDDHIFDMILSDKMTPKNSLAYDIVCLDETQDQTKLYFDFMKYTLGFLSVFPTLIVLGDRYQSIYEFKGTDARFLTFADRIWNRPFVTLPLSTSYRLTHPIASFLNRDVLGENRMQTIKDGPPICYIRCDPCHVSHCTVLLSKMQPYKPHDIFILTPSLKGKHTKWLENILVKQGVPCYYPTSEDTRLDDEIIDGKVVFCTFHQAKGRERKCVIVYHFDLSYFTFYARDCTMSVCSNALYVALTRSSETLIVLESFKSEPLPFLPPLADLKTRSYIDVHEVFYEGVGVKDSKPEDDEIHQTSVTDLLKFVKDKYLLPLTTLVEQLFVMDQKRQYLVDLPDKLQMGQTVESVAEINGLVIPSIYESETLGRSSIVDYVDEHMRKKEKKEKKSHYLRAYYDKIEKTATGSSQSVIKRYIQYALLYTSLQHGVLNNLAQIDDVSWLTDKMVDDCHRLLYRELGARDIPIEFEVPVFYECTDYNEYGVIQLSGRIDAFQGDYLYEIKCVDALTLEHFLQLVVYAWMDMESSTGDAGTTTYTLLNLKTGEVHRLDTANVAKINDIILILFKNKFGESKRLTNREFLDSFL
jgi:hypothetical protein